MNGTSIGVEIGGYQVFVSGVTDVTKSTVSEFDFPFKDSNLIAPFITYVKVADLYLFPNNRDGEIGFCTEEGASEHREDIIDILIGGNTPMGYVNFTKAIGVVLKNADSIEGNGPMLVDSVWPNIVEAYHHIKTKPGYIKDCRQKIFFSVNRNKSLQVHTSYGNGMYKIIAAESGFEKQCFI